MSVTLKSPSGVSLPLGTRIYELPLLYSGTSFTELTRVPTSWAETRNRGSNVAISTRQAIPCPSLPTKVGSHEYGNNGESFYQRRPLKTSCGFHPDIHHHCCPSDSISPSLPNGFLNQVRLFLRHERILQRPLLFVKEAFMVAAVHPC